MRRPLKVVHLVDDTTAGGVTRVVDFILSSNATQSEIRHERQIVSRGKLLATRYDADVIVSHLTISWRSLPSLLLLRASNVGKRLVHVEHSYTEAFVAHNVPNQRRFLSLLRIGFSLFDRIVGVSFAQSDWMTAKKLCASNRISTIQSCVDLSPFHDVPAPDGPKRIFGAIGRLDRQKGFDVLVDAFKACPIKDIRLFIFGEGEEEEKLRALAAGDPRIEFKGFAASPIDAFSQVDVVMMPSRWEAYGLVAIEALSAKRTLICTDADGLRDHRSLGAEFFEQYTTGCITRKIAEMRSRASGSAPDMGNPPKALEEIFLSKWQALLSELSESPIDIQIANRSTSKPSELPNAESHNGPSTPAIGALIMAAVTIAAQAFHRQWRMAASAERRAPILLDLECQLWAGRSSCHICSSQ